MLDLISAGADRRLVIPPYETMRVPAPPVRAALTVLKAAGPDAGLRASLDLRSACAGWLPTRAFSVLFSQAFSEDRRLAALEALVASGMPEWLGSDPRETDPKVALQAAQDTDWSSLLARYRAAYSLTWDEVMAEPWPVFLAQLEDTGRMQAREQMRFIRAYTALRSEDGQSLLDDIAEAASFRGDGGGRELSEEEQAEREREKKKLMAEAYQTRQHLLN